MATFSVSAVQKMYKEVFKGGAPAMLAMRGKPALSRARKVDDFEGDPMTIAIRTHLHTGASHTFSDAQGQDTANDIYRLSFRPKKHYAVVKYDPLALALARSNLGSFLRGKAKETEETLEHVGQRMEREFWQGTTLGAITAVPSNVTGSTYRVTMATQANIIGIQVGMTIECWDTADTTSSTQRAETCVVTAVNHAAGTFDGTFTGNPTAWAASNTDYLFTKGDRSGSEIKGWTSISDYIPSSDPGGSDAFQAGSLNRSAMPNYLAGWRGTTYTTIEETAQQLCTLMSPYVSSIAGKSEFWLHPKGFQVLQAEAGARLIRDQSTTPVLGYTKVRIATAMGDIPVNVGPFCPQSVLWLLDWSTIVIHTNKPLFHTINEDGLEMTRGASADEFEWRARSWSELVVEEPVKNGRAAINV